MPSWSTQKIVTSPRPDRRRLTVTNRPKDQGVSNGCYAASNGDTP
jgi:hypothetical protein